MKQHSKKILSVIFSLLLFAFFATPLLYAADTASKGYALLAPIPTVNPDIGTPSLPEYLKSLVKLFVGLAIVFAVFMIVYGGVKYTVASTPNAKSGAKKYMTEAILGLLIALFSYLLLQTINPALLNVGLNLEDVQFDPYSDIISTSSTPKPANTVCVVLANTCNESCETKNDATECGAVEDSYKASGYPSCDSGAETKPCISYSCGSSGRSTVPKGCGSGATSGGNSLPCQEADAAKQRLNSGGTSCNNEGSCKRCDTSQWNSYISASASKYGVKEDAIRAVIARESGCRVNPGSVDGKSCGLMQVTYPCSIDPATNIDQGAKKLASAYQTAKQLKLRYGDTVTEDELAYATYNGGAGNSAVSVDCNPLTGWPTIPKWACPINPGTAQYNACFIRSNACGFSACF